MARSLQLGLVVVLATVVVVGAIVVSGNGADDETTVAPPATAGSTPAEDVAALYEGIPQKGMRLGKADVTLVEIADLQCPFCAQY
jgi:hypothetical protein